MLKKKIVFLYEKSRANLVYFRNSFAVLYNRTPEWLSFLILMALDFAFIYLVGYLLLRYTGFHIVVAKHVSPTYEEMLIAYLNESFKDRIEKLKRKQ